MSDARLRRMGVRSLRAVAALGLSLALAAPAVAQLPPRLTAGSVADQLDAAGRRLAAQTGTAAIAAQLHALAQDLRGNLADRLAQPLTALDDRDRGRVLRAHAAASLGTDFADAAAGCREGEAAVMAQALALSVRHLAQAPAVDKPLQATIDRVEAVDHAPLFALRPSAAPVALALVGSELTDPQCPDPQLTATDASGAPLAKQPRITGVLPGRIEFEWPATAALKQGGYLLHVRPQHKAFLVGCTAQPEAAVALQRVPSPKFTVGYVLEGVCGRSDPRTLALGKGTLPPLEGYGATVAQVVDTTACTDPVAYRISATVGYADGASATAGPFEQSADANLTVGLPGGLSLSWDPAVRRLFVRSGAPMCKGVR
ncbi:hypothetical protein [Frateuria sp. STR12]|uniref:hypothetical protein n=1 Tax=Frateuria hangzhouensis TaxID=2995589 RepID=UPI002260D36F|nr:hypothetical protein [Frateuria sp. STR12]MCX7514350.1 hypothetical protein [Frateuria sp. STR12]